MLSALLNWFKLVYGPFGQSNMHRTLNFWPNQPGRNWMCQSQRLAKVLLFNLYIVHGKSPRSTTSAICQSRELFAQSKVTRTKCLFMSRSRIWYFDSPHHVASSVVACGLADRQAATYQATSRIKCKCPTGGQPALCGDMGFRWTSQRNQIAIE